MEKKLNNIKIKIENRFLVVSPAELAKIQKKYPLVQIICKTL